MTADLLITSFTYEKDSKNLQCDEIDACAVTL